MKSMSCKAGSDPRAKLFDPVREALAIHAHIELAVECERLARQRILGSHLRPRCGWDR
jgi:hypothetical protein